MGNANSNPSTEAKVDTKNPDRGPLLIIDGEEDHTVPWAIANAAYKRQKRNPGVTEIVQVPNRGHSLTIDHGWRGVAQLAPAFVKRFGYARVPRGVPTSRQLAARLGRAWGTTGLAHDRTPDARDRLAARRRPGDPLAGPPGRRRRAGRRRRHRTGARCRGRLGRPDPCP